MEIPQTRVLGKQLPRLILVIGTFQAFNTWAGDPLEQVQISVQSYSATNQIQDHDLYLRGLHKLNDVLKEKCNLEDSLKIQPTIQLTPPDNENSPFQFDKDRPQLNYQRDFFNLLQKANFVTKSHEEILIFFVENLNQHCAFAYPTVALQNNALNGIDLRHTVLVSGHSKPGDCINKSRIIAHELGHVLIQDDPPHHYQDSMGQLIPFPETNLLATYSWVSTPPAQNYETPDPWSDGFGYQKVEAQGWDLTEAQCSAIQKTMKEEFTKDSAPEIVF